MLQLDAVLVKSRDRINTEIIIRHVLLRAIY